MLSSAAALLDGLFEQPAAPHPLIIPISCELLPEKIENFLAQQAAPRHNAEEPQTTES